MRKYGPFKGKKSSRKSVLEKDLTEDTLDKDLRVTVLKMLKERKENVEEVKKQCMNKIKVLIKRKPKRNQKEILEMNSAKIKI